MVCNPTWMPAAATSSSAAPASVRTSITICHYRLLARITTLKVVNQCLEGVT